MDEFKPNDGGAFWKELAAAAFANHGKPIKFVVSKKSSSHPHALITKHNRPGFRLRTRRGFAENEWYVRAERIRQAKSGGKANSQNQTMPILFHVAVALKCRIDSARQRLGKTMREWMTDAAEAKLRREERGE